MAFNPKEGNVCGNCNLDSESLVKNLLKCSKCEVALYCGRRCQVQAYQDHKKNCNSFYKGKMVRRELISYFVEKAKG